MDFVEIDADFPVGYLIDRIDLSGKYSLDQF